MQYDDKMTKAVVPNHRAAAHWCAAQLLLVCREKISFFNSCQVIPISNTQLKVMLAYRLTDEHFNLNLEK